MAKAPPVTAGDDLKPLNRVIFSCWTGANRMSSQRRSAFESLRRNSGIENVHITRATLARWIDPSLPLHSLFCNLSAVHQSDYLRCYLLHLHGGGYSDIKPTQKCWVPFFDALESSVCLGAGYTEIGPQGVAPVGGELEETLKANFDKLIGCCAMLFRPGSTFTTRWFQRLTEVMDSKAAELSRYPARHPFDRRGVRYANGKISKYPIKWTELMGDIFHPLVYEYRHRLLQLEMAPLFKSYK